MSDRNLTAHSKVNMQDAEERAFWCGFFAETEAALADAVPRGGAYVAVLDVHIQASAARAA